MGLDNGLVLRVHNKDILEDRAFCRASLRFAACEDIRESEICYWRKCWNVRELLYEAAGIEDQDGSGEIPLTKEAVEHFYWSLRHLGESGQWENDYISGRTIWDWDSYRDTGGRQLFVLEQVLQALRTKDYKDGEDYEFYFYDSY